MVKYSQFKIIFRLLTLAMLWFRTTDATFYKTKHVFFLFHQLQTINLIIKF